MSCRSTCGRTALTTALSASASPLTALSNSEPSNPNAMVPSLGLVHLRPQLRFETCELRAALPAATAPARQSRTPGSPTLKWKAKKREQRGSGLLALLTVESAGDTRGPGSARLATHGGRDRGRSPMGRRRQREDSRHSYRVCRYGRSLRRGAQRRSYPCYARRRGGRVESFVGPRPRPEGGRSSHTERDPAREYAMRTRAGDGHRSGEPRRGN